MNLGQLTAYLGADISDFERKIASAQSRMEQTGKAMQKAGKRMSMFVTAPIVALGGIAVKVGMDFEKAMNQVAAVSQATGQEMEQLTALAREMGATTKFSANEAAGALNFLAMAGFSVEESMQALPHTLSLASAGNMDLAESADIVSNVMQGFGWEAGRTEQAVDVLTKAFTSANTNLQELGHGMSFAAPMSKAYGISLEETTAALGMLSDAGIKGGRSGTTFARILAQLSKTADGLGLDIRDANGDLLSMADILEVVENSGYSSQQMIDALGQRAGPGFSVLMDRGSDALREFTGELEDSGGTAKQVSDIQMQGLAGGLIQLRSALTEVAISLTESLMEPLRKAADRMVELARRVGAMDDSTKRWILGIAGVAAAIGPLLIVAGTLIRSIISIRIAMAALNAVMLANPFIAVATAALTLGGALAILLTRKDAVEKAQRRINRAVESAIQPLVREQTEIQVLVGMIRQAEEGTDARRRAVESLNEKYPELLSNYDKEKITNAELKEVLDKVNASYEERIKLRVLEATQQQAIEEQSKAQIELWKLEQEELDLMRKLSADLHGTTEEGIKVTEGLIRGWTRRLESNRKAQEQQNGVMQETNQIISQATEGINLFLDRKGEEEEQIKRTAAIIKQEIGQQEKLLQQIQEGTFLMGDKAKETERLKNKISELNDELEGLNKTQTVQNQLSEEELELQQKKAEAFEREKQAFISSIDDKIEARKTANMAEAELLDYHHAEMLKLAEEFNVDSLKIDELYANLKEDLRLREEAEERAHLERRYEQIKQANMSRHELMLMQLEQEEEALRKMVDAGIISWDEFATQVELSNKRIRDSFDDTRIEVGQNMTRMQNDMTDFQHAMIGMIESMTYSFSEFIMTMITGLDKGEKSMGDFVRDLARHVVRFVAGQIAMAVAKIIVDEIMDKGYAGAATGAALAGVASSMINTEVMSGMAGAFQITSGLQGLASGGNVTSSGVFDVGERGRERVFLPAGSAVTPHKDLGVSESLIAEIDGKKLRIILDRSDAQDKRRGRIS